MSENFEKNLETEQIKAPVQSNNAIDAVTGFLDGKVSPKAKTGFLQGLKTTGNQSIAADKQGFTWPEIAQELASDLKFKESYDETLLKMRHAIESKLYLAGLAGKAKEGLIWLQAHFPETYKPALNKKPKKAENHALNRILDGLEG